MSAKTFVDTKVLVYAHDVDAGGIEAAFRIEEEARVSFWDALICATALKSGAQRILSEDLNAGQKIAAIRIENPFPPYKAIAGSS
jgi:predicted nucleic acid-binding protein